MSAGDESFTGEVIPPPPAQAERVLVWSRSWWSTPAVSDQPEEAGGDGVTGGMEPTLGRRGGDTSRLGSAGHVRETKCGVRLRRYCFGVSFSRETEEISS